MNAPLIRDSVTGKMKELPSTQDVGVTLHQLGNVAITNPQDGDVVAYHAATQTYRNAPNTASAEFTPAQQFFV
jgi:hypothetical protein